MGINGVVTVIIPVYNVEQYIVRCVHSVMEQTYKNIEILIIDDGSTDKSIERINCFVKKDSRIKIIHQKNGGLSSARNTGIDNAAGEYVLFVDGDDYLEKNCIEKVINAAKGSRQYDIVLFPYVKVFKNKKVKSKLFKEETSWDRKGVREVLLQRLIGPANDNINKIEEMDRINTAWGKLYKRNVIGKIRYTDTKLIGAEDGWFNINVFYMAQSAIYIESVYYCYEKENTSSLLHDYDREYYQKRKRAYSCINEFLIEKDLLQWQKNLRNREVLEIVGIINKMSNSNMKFMEKIKELKSILSDHEYENAVYSFPVNKMQGINRLLILACKAKASMILIIIGKLFYYYRRIFS